MLLTIQKFLNSVLFNKYCDIFALNFNKMAETFYVILE
jgi:hypothetical protein